MVRQQRTQSAHVLLSLYTRGDLADPSIWTWQALDLLPSWCLASAEDRRVLQRICGALYLSPELRLWIAGPAVLSLHQCLGEAVSVRIMQHADDMQLPREPLTALMDEAGVNEQTVNDGHLDSLLLSLGGHVLAATVDQSLPRDMLLGSLHTDGVTADGPRIDASSIALDAQGAWMLLDAAVALLHPEPAASVTDGDGAQLDDLQLNSVAGGVASSENAAKSPVMQDGAVQ